MSKALIVAVVLFLLPSLASAQEPCSEDPRYLLVTVLEGWLYPHEGETKEIATGPYLLDLCDTFSMLSDADGAVIVRQTAESLIQLIVSETLAELCRAMSSCTVVSDTPSEPGAAEAG